MTTKTWTAEMAADLRRRREAAGVSRYLVAKTVGCPPAQVDSWEAGGWCPSRHALAEIERLIIEAADAPPRTSTAKWALADRFDGDRLRALRQASGYSQVKFAHRLGTDMPRIWKWEKGHGAPGQYFADKLCEVFGCEPEDLCRPAD